MYILNSLFREKMKKIFTIIILCVIFHSAFSQSMEELESINRKSKVLFVRPEILDKLLIDLRKFESPVVHNQDSLILDTYDAIASGYMANNHFKRAYEVYDKYLMRKEEMLLDDKNTAILAANTSFEGKQQINERNVNELQDKLNTLTNDNEALISSRQSFKSLFSFILIFLTAIFAVMLVTAGIQMMNIRSSLQKNRARIKSIHRIALIGKYSEGIKNSLKVSLLKIGDQVKELQQILKKQEQGTLKQTNQILSGADKIYQETVSKL